MPNFPSYFTPVVVRIRGAKLSLLFSPILESCLLVGNEQYGYSIDF